MSDTRRTRSTAQVGRGLCSAFPAQGRPDPEDLRDLPGLSPQRIAVSPLGMVATAQCEATAAGVDALEAGGNAVDAAVAAAFALCVCEPAASGLGGQTMMLLHIPNLRKTIALDGSSRAPHRATPGSVRPEDLVRGHRATTVPSTPATLDYVLRRYGRLDLPTALAPAIRLAEDGYRVSRLQHRLAARELDNLREGNAARLFLRDGRRPYREGSRFRQPILARTLRRLAETGIEDFYGGEIAALIDRDMAANGGLLQMDDLAQVPWPLERRPVSCRCDDMRVMTFPPPGAGRTLVEMINILAHFTKAERDPDSAEGAVLLARVIQQAFRDRRDRPYDPHLYAQVEEKYMLSPEYAHATADELRADLVGHGETTHLSTADRNGIFVSLTQSIEKVYGACTASPDLGFLYNNYMSAFEHEDASHPYYLRPNAVPWASVAPSIAFRGRRPWLAIGSPGSERITPSILQVLLRLADHTPFEAVDAPRLHCSISGRVSLEASRMRSDIPAALRRSGFSVAEREPYSFFLGCVQLVLRDGEDLVGVADPRRDGSAAGPISERTPAPR